MSYLIDTNVLSELRKKIPDANVLTWFSQRPANTLFLSVLSLGEIRKGIEKLTDEKRRWQLSDWLETDLPRFFAGRILPITTQIADEWGRLLAQADRPLPAIDSLLAATALTHHLTLVTRNVKDFSDFKMPLINPWLIQNTEA